MKKIRTFEGISAYDSKIVRGGICLPGIGIFINTRLFPKSMLDSVLIHEYGHYLDYKNSADLRPFPFVQFYVKIGIPSLINAVTGLGGPHKKFWTEIRANRQAKAYFGDALAPNFEQYFPMEK